MQFTHVQREDPDLTGKDNPAPAAAIYKFRLAFHSPRHGRLRALEFPCLCPVLVWMLALCLSLFHCLTFRLRRSWQLSPAPTPTPVPGSLNSLNHIILFMQENRTFDHYFGQLNAYRAKQTPPLPQDLDTWSPTLDKTPTNVSTPGYDPAQESQGPPLKRSTCRAHAQRT